MTILHLVGGDAAAGNLVLALQGSGRDDEVLGCVDDLSCGPIDKDEPDARAVWWGDWWAPDEGRIKDRVRSFWTRVTESSDQLVVWFGRHSAMEHAFFLALAYRLGERPYSIVDVTAVAPQMTKGDGSPVQAVALASHEALGRLLAVSRPAAADEKRRACARWDRLKAENAPFRIVTETGLRSVGEDYFDPWLMACLSDDWRRMARVIGHALGDHLTPYLQVSDGILQARLIELIGKGVLQAEGDFWDMHACRVRLAEGSAGDGVQTVFDEARTPMKRCRWVGGTTVQSCRLPNQR